MSLTLFAKNLTYLLQKKGFKGKDLAASLGVSAGRVSTWINGKYEPPHSVLIMISDFLEESIDNLLRVDLELHPNDEQKNSIKSNRNTPNATPYTTPKSPNFINAGSNLPGITVDMELLRAKDETIAVQQKTILAQEKAITALEDAKSVLNQQLIQVKDENANLKRALPVIPPNVAGHSGGGERKETA